MPASAEIEALKGRRDKARGDRQSWGSIVDDAYAFMCPYRKSANGGSTPRRVDHLFDNTGIVSTFRGAGQMQQDIFPPGQVFFNLKPGPVAKSFVPTGAADDDDKRLALQQFERDLDNVSAQVTPFFLTGEWDNAVSELCVDFYISTGVMLILEGDDARPVRFITLPFEEIALELGSYGDTSGLFWRTQFTRRMIKATFPKGKFDTEFEQGFKDDPDGQVELWQDFVADGAGGWRFIATISTSEEPIATQTYKTKPFVASGFYRMPGATYHCGPALLALPTVKTLNKAMELSLKNFAIQMLGIWGYRPGGTFAPENAPLRPGGFWPMQSTGGVMGPDVTRLDAGGNSASMQQIVLGELRNQAQTSLHDEQLPDTGKTPRSAAETIGRLARIKQNYVGAYGRMIHEVIPVVVPRVMEILFNRGLVTSRIPVDKLLVAVDVVSPIAMALKAEAYKATVEGVQLTAGLEGPQAVGRRFKIDDLMPDMLRDLGINANYVRTVQELAAFDQQQKTAANQGAVASAMLDKPDKFAAALQSTPESVEAA